MPHPFASKVEYWLVEPQLARAEVERGCAIAAREEIAAVYVKPHYVETARKCLKETHVKVGAVIAFPHGGMTTAAKMFETQDALTRGASEIAMSLNLGALRDADDLAVKNDIAAVVKTARGHAVTVIVETPYLNDEEKTRAAQSAEAAGAAFVQTSSGFAGDATYNDVRLLWRTLTRAQLKVAGAIDSVALVEKLVEAGAARVASNRVAALFSDSTS